MSPFSERLTPEEAHRRKAAVAKVTKLVTRYGFRTMPAKPGHFYHPDIGQDIVFEWENLDGVGDLLQFLYFRGLREGMDIQKKKARELFGL